MDTSNHEGSGVKVKCFKGISFEEIIILKGTILKHTAWEDGERIFTFHNGFMAGMELSLTDSDLLKHFELAD